MTSCLSRQFVHLLVWKRPILKKTVAVMGMQTLLLFCHYEIRERYFGFLLRSLNALLIQNRHSLVGWEASFLKLPTPESWKKVNFMPCYLIRTSTGKNFHMVIQYTVHSHFSQDRQDRALTGSGCHLGFICKKMYGGGKRRD